MSEHMSQLRLELMLAGKLSRHFGVEWSEATNEQIYKACVLVVRDMLMDKWLEGQQRLAVSEAKQLYYLSMEFLMGRSLKNNIYNMGLCDIFEKTLRDGGYKIEDIFEVEGDAGLGNGGLGRLAACYLDSLASLGLPAWGFSIMYEYGIFRQRIIDGAQVELPDNWLESGESWLIPRLEETCEVRFGGELSERWDDKGLVVEHKNYSSVLAVPFDMLVSGYGSATVDTLRLWSAKSPYTIDMNLFGRGEYIRAMEQKSLAEVISKVLYPEDNHYEGKSLRLKQQYFFVSATVQTITKKHFAQYGTLENLPDKAVIHINDTHPALVIPELMRILMDDYGYGWDKAWSIVTRTVAYTNHTVMSEALERWPRQLFSTLLPRIDQIVNEINERLCRGLWDAMGNWDRVGDMSIISHNEVRMANLCVASCFSVNGVSELHSNIIKDKVFADFNHIMGDKFKNVTNGIAHRRWLCQANPGLTKLIKECIGDGFYKKPQELARFAPFADDGSVRERMAAIKRQNKEHMASYIKEHKCIDVDPDLIFDVQIKRLHEYKRQLLNVMHIIYLCHRIRENPNIDLSPALYVFGAKASAGYYMAKQIIRLIHSVESEINSDPVVSRLLKVAFLDDYRVTLAEQLIPAAEVSEQISLAGMEASGTGNMKFMMNGALTLGTLDGANVEIAEAAGNDNIFIFGLKAHEVDNLVKSGQYAPIGYYNADSRIRGVLDHMNAGIGRGILRASYGDIVNALLLGNGSAADRYMLLADFDSYVKAHEQVDLAYRSAEGWNKKSIINVAASGRFAADRAVGEYAKNIWGISPITP